MVGRRCQGCGDPAGALLRGFNGAKDMVLCPSCRARRLQPFRSDSPPFDEAVPAEGPCWVLGRRSYVPSGAPPKARLRSDGAEVAS